MVAVASMAGFPLAPKPAREKVEPLKMPSNTGDTQQKCWNLNNLCDPDWYFCPQSDINDYFVTITLPLLKHHKLPYIRALYKSDFSQTSHRRFSMKITHFISLTFFVVLSLALTNCSDSEDAQPTPVSEIVKAQRDEISSKQWCLSGKTSEGFAETIRISFTENSKFKKDRLINHGVPFKNQDKWVAYSVDQDLYDWHVDKENDESTVYSNEKKYKFTLINSTAINYLEVIDPKRYGSEDRESNVYSQCPEEVMKAQEGTILDYALYRRQAVIGSSIDYKRLYFPRMMFPTEKWSVHGFQNQLWCNSDANPGLPHLYPEMKILKFNEDGTIMFIDLRWRDKPDGYGNAPAVRTSGFARQQYRVNDQGELWIEEPNEYVEEQKVKYKEYPSFIPTGKKLAFQAKIIGNGEDSLMIFFDEYNRLDEEMSSAYSHVPGSSIYYPCENLDRDWASESHSYKFGIKHNAEVNKVFHEVEAEGYKKWPWDALPSL